MIHGKTMDSKDPKTAKIVLNKKQLYALIKFSKDYYLLSLERLGLDTEALKLSVLLDYKLDQIFKEIWQTFTDDDEITLPLEIPDLEEDGGNNHGRKH